MHAASAGTVACVRREVSDALRPRPRGLPADIDDVRAVVDHVQRPLAGLFGLRAGCICVVSDRTPWPGPATIDLDRNMDQCIEVARAAMLDLASKSEGD